MSQDPVAATPPAVSLRHITKRFGEVVAIDDATLDIQRGEIHALLGENGAGKTSLTNVLAGVYRPDAGEVLLDGRPVVIRSPEDAKRHRIGMVHQEQRLVGRLTAPENVSLGHDEPRWLTLQRYFARLAERLSDQYQLAIDPVSPVWSLPIGRRQRVELVKLLHHGARVIILDEPTANLAPAEVDTFFTAIRQLTATGRTVIFITHKLDEVIRYTDRVTVMRAGRIVSTFPTATTTRDSLNRLMVGDEGSLAERESGATVTGGVVLAVRDLSVDEPELRMPLAEVTFEVRAGEVLGIAGVAGNGQTELAETITGHVVGYRGSVCIADREIGALDARGVSDLGVAYVPEDRRNVGLIPGQSVAINLALRRFDRAPLSRRGWVDYGTIRREAVRLIDRYGIRPPDPDLPAGRLSGGNQQRVIIAREFSRRPRLIVADNFTRGLDPRSTQQFTQELFAVAREDGAAVVLITSDLGEALQCDRVGVMNRGRLVAVLGAGEATRERVGLLMSGDVPREGAGVG